MMPNEKMISLKDGDQRLSFIIRKMRPMQLELWLFKALSLMDPGPDATENDYAEAGKKLAEEGFWPLMRTADPDAVLALTNQLLDCCTRSIENVEQHCTPDAVNGCVQDVSTLMTLKNEALKYNLAFLLQEAEPFGKKV